jgi:phage gp36-like protein
MKEESSRMGYATLEDVETRLGPAACVQLTDDEGAGSANVARLAEAVAAAEAEIDSRLAGRYAVPVDVSAEVDAAGLLRALTLDLAEHRLYARRPPVPDDVRLKATAAREWLHDILVGRAHLPLSQPTRENAAQGIVAEIFGTPRVFRRDGGVGSTSNTVSA